MKKVLHVIENFNVQAIEKWLYQLMRQLKLANENMDWTFYSTVGVPGKYDQDIQALGGKIIYSPIPLKKKWHFLKNFRQVLISEKFDILHCHQDVMSAIYLIAAIGLPLDKIIHLHNTSFSLPTSSHLKSTLLQKPMRLACLYLADSIVGVSKVTLEAFLLNTKPKCDRRDVIIHCGIDMSAFHPTPCQRSFFLKALGLSANSRVLLFVGRMIDYKNPCFLIEIMEKISRLDPAFCTVFVGAGPLENKVLKMANLKSLESRVRVLGWRDDIPSLMMSCDMLICPSLEDPKEGLGLVIIEAQAAGLPVLMSLSVPDEAIVVNELVDILPLAAGAHIWATKIFDALQRSSLKREEALTVMKRSSFAISYSAESIQKLYRT
jgi:glycosyltransferase involved in cell wall biosynthesis